MIENLVHIAFFDNLTGVHYHYLVASPFIGRLDDISVDGLQLIADVVEIYDAYPAIRTEVLVASVRHPLHVVESAKLGAHVATMPAKVIEQLAKHPLTDIGLERFLADWEKVKNRS